MEVCKSSASEVYTTENRRAIRAGPPTVGLMPTMPLTEAGAVTEPSVSVSDTHRAEVLRDSLALGETKPLVAKGVSFGTLTRKRDDRGTIPTSGQVHPTASGRPPCTQRLTITSTPCGATIYIDGMQSGQTPITFPMPPGRYSVMIIAPGHQRFSQRILISDAPFELKANLIPLP